MDVISGRNWIELVCGSLNITFSFKIDHNNLIYEIFSEKLGFCICAFIFVSKNLLFEKFLHCGLENIMNIDERFAEMALAIQQLTQVVTRIEMNQQERGMPMHNHERNTEDKTLRLDVYDFGGTTHNPEDYLEWEAGLEGTLNSRKPLENSSTS